MGSLGPKLEPFNVSFQTLEAIIQAPHTPGASFVDPDTGEVIRLTIANYRKVFTEFTSREPVIVSEPEPVKPEPPKTRGSGNRKHRGTDNNPIDADVIPEIAVVEQPNVQEPTVVEVSVEIIDTNPTVEPDIVETVELESTVENNIVETDSVGFNTEADVTDECEIPEEPESLITDETVSDNGNPDANRVVQDAIIQRISKPNEHNRTKNGKRK